MGLRLRVSVRVLGFGSAAAPWLSAAAPSACTRIFWMSCTTSESWSIAAELMAFSELYTKKLESSSARQKIFASCPSVCEIDARPSVSRSSRCFGAPGALPSSLSGAPHIQMPFVHACTDEPTPKPLCCPASWLSMYDLPVRYTPATAHTATVPRSLESEARASSVTRSWPVFESSWMKGTGALMI